MSSTKRFDPLPLLLRRSVLLLLPALVLATPGVLLAQTPEAPAEAVTVSCTSVAGDSERQRCDADTSTGVLLQRSVGSTLCLLGRNWGYDAQGVWVSEGCSGEFLISGESAEAPAEEEEAAPADDQPERWGFLDPGKGFVLGKGKGGELSLSAYALVRYMNQMDDDGIFFDHLGRERPVKEREDIFSQRVLVWLTGWVGVPKLEYMITFWALNATNDSRLFGNINYRFNKHFNLAVGINGNPGSRSMLGSHPYWLAHDRVMADEFFRPFFTQGIWANGEIVDRLFYNVSVGNSSSSLGNTALDLDRKPTYGGSLWWMPTTGEFGPRGAYGDWEMHEKLATRFGASAVHSLEQRYTEIGEAPSNTVLRLVDSVNLFETGALAPGVTIVNADYTSLAIDAGVKYRGIFLQTEFYWRTLDAFDADGLLPVSQIKDRGFYVQAAFYPIPRKLEFYAVTSQIYGDKDAGFGNASEYLAGLNYYIADTRNHRINLQVMDVNRSSVDSVFGFYTAGQDGTTVSVAASVFF